MSHWIMVRNFRKTRRAIRDSNGVTVRKEVRKTNVRFIRDEYCKINHEEYINSIDPKHFKKTTDPHSNTPYDSVDWKNIIKS